MKPVFSLILLLHCIPLFGQLADTAYAEQNFDKALDLLRSGKYDSAHYYYRIAADIYDKTELRERYGTILYHLGLSRHFIRKDTDALAYYEESLEELLPVKPEVDPYITDLYNNIGSIYLDQGFRFKAKPYLKTSMEMNEQLYGTEHHLTGTCYYNNGLLAMYFGEYKSSLDYFMKARAPYISEYGENGARVAQLYNNVGILHKHIGDLGLARDYFERSIAIHMENNGPDYWNLAFPYTTLASVFESEGDNQKAMEYRRRALELCKNNPDKLRRLEGNVMATLAIDYRKQGQYDEALSHIQEAIDIMIEKYHDKFPTLSDFYNVRGDIYVDMKDYSEADRWYNKSIDIITMNYGKVHPKLATSYHKQAGIFAEKKLYDRALEQIQKGFRALTASFDSDDPHEYPSLDSVPDPRQFLRLSLDRAEVFYERGKETENAQDLENALRHFEVVTYSMDKIRRGYLSENSKLFMQQTAIVIYEQAIESCNLLFAMNQDESHLEKAFFFMEKSKSTVLSEAIQASNLQQVRGINPEILAKEEEQNSYVQSLELKFADAQIGESDSVQRALKQELFNAKFAVDSLAAHIEDKYPNYHNLKYNTAVVSLDEVRDLLEKNGMAISYFEGDSSWYVMSISGNAISLEKVGKETINPEQIEEFRKLISNPGSSIEEFSPLAHSIYSNLLKGAIEEHERPERILVIPDGNLGYIPFDALLSEAHDPGKKPRYLIHNHVISYANSLTLMHQNIERESEHEQEYVGFAPDYPETFIAVNTIPAENLYRDELTRLLGTREEVSYASKIFAGNTFLDSAATEENFKKLIESPTILHLAMHALLNDKDPMRSQLIFSHGVDSLEDGRLNAYEIYSLDIRSELAVLSACNTGIGKINKGEGVLSLSRAFMYAGCPNIVMSLWRAKDQPSAQIISTFFEKLKENESKDEALRDAKLSYLETADPLKAHPANWATFVLLGDSKPLHSGSKSLILWTGAALVFLFILIFARFRKQSHRS